jgi:hypothetical protein
MIGAPFADERSNSAATAGQIAAARSRRERLRAPAQRICTRAVLAEVLRRRVADRRCP